MKKIFFIFLLAFTILFSLLWGCGDDDDNNDDNDDDVQDNDVADDDEADDDDQNDDDDATGAPESVEDVIQILLARLDTSGKEGSWVAHVAPAPLTQDTAVVPAEGQTAFTPGGDYWFAFVDEDPFAWFEHEVKFVFIDAATGAMTVEDQSWWPEVDGQSFLDSGRGLVKVFAAAAPEWRASQTKQADGVKAEAPSADYGDAPDDTWDDDPDLVYFRGGISGKFPTLFETDNSVAGRPGGHALAVGEETIGPNVSAENDANDPDDPDEAPNLVDQDRDDGVFWVFYPDLAAGKLNVRFAVNVAVAAGAPDQDRYLNILADHNRDGRWQRNDRGAEWLVENFAVRVPPGEAAIVWTDPVELPLSTDNHFGSESWLRIALTRSPIDRTPFGSDGWDGSGQFAYGEIEDHYFNFTPWSDDDDDDGPDPEPPDPPDPGAGVNPKDCSYTCLQDLIDIPINCRALVINFGDRRSDESHVTRDAERAKAFYEHYLGANNVTYLPTGDNPTPTADAALTAIQNFVAAGQCLDEMIIYLAGHGGRSGYIRAQNGKGKLTPQQLKAAITAQDHCPAGMDYYLDGCRDSGFCNLNIFIQSCYSGNFSKGADSLAIDGVNLMTASNDSRKARGSADGSGGYVSEAYFGAFKDNQADNDPWGDGDGTVSPEEAMAYAKDSYGGPNTGADYHAGADCKCGCTLAEWEWDDPAEDLIFWEYEVKEPPTYVGHLDIIHYGIAITDDGFDAMITTANDLPGSGDTGFHEYYAVFDTALPNYTMPSPTHDGDTAYIAQFLDGNWTMFLFIYQDGIGWMNTFTSSTVDIAGAEMLMHITTAESGIDFNSDFTPTRMATWYRQDGTINVGDDTEIQYGVKGGKCY